MKCAPLIDCPNLEDTQLYSLEDPPLSSVIGPASAETDEMHLNCCGYQITIDLRGMTQEDRQAAINQALRDCERSQAFCGKNTDEWFCNDPITQAIPCPDGSIFTSNVAGCTYVAADKDTANGMALAAAGKAQPICLTDIPACCCVGVPYAAVIKTSTPKTALSWSVSGHVPPGLTVHTTSPGQTTSSCIIDGTPTVNGPYFFNIKATNKDGQFIVKSFTIKVIEIITPTLDPYTVGVPYSFQLTAAGGSGNYVWKIASGTLPAGLTLSLTGLISGTPTA